MCGTQHTYMYLSLHFTFHRCNMYTNVHDHSFSAFPFTVHHCRQSLSCLPDVASLLLQTNVHVFFVPHHHCPPLPWKRALQENVPTKTQTSSNLRRWTLVAVHGQVASQMSRQCGRGGLLWLLERLWWSIDRRQSINTRPTKVIQKYHGLSIQAWCMLEVFQKKNHRPRRPKKILNRVGRSMQLYQCTMHLMMYLVKLQHEPNQWRKVGLNLWRHVCPLPVLCFHCWW